MKKKLLSRLAPLALALVLVAVLLPNFAMEAEAWTNIVANDGFTVCIESGHPGGGTTWCSHPVDESHNITVMNNNGTLTISGTVKYYNRCHSKYYTNSFTVQASGFSCETNYTTSNFFHVGTGRKDVEFTDGTCLDIFLTRSAGHAVSSWTSSNNQHSGTCSLCGETVTENCSGGKATCVAPATCSTCKKPYGSADTVNGHDWSAWTTDDTTHSHECRRGGCGKTESGNHTTVGGAAASCTTPNKCGICDVEYGEPTGHKLEYSSTDSRPYTITQRCMVTNCHVACADVPFGGEKFTYTGEEIKPNEIQYDSNWIGDYLELQHTDDDYTNVGTKYVSIGRFSIPFEIVPKMLTVTIDNQTITYGDAVPELTYTIEGFAGAETAETALSGMPAIQLETSYEQGDKAGEYWIQFVHESMPEDNKYGNYQFDYTAGMLTVNKAEPTVTAPKAKTDLVYAPGTAHVLVEAGSTTVGEMRYSTLEDGTYGSIPVASNAGTYKVWYKAVVEETDPNYINYTSSDPDFVEVTIAKGAPDYAAPTPKRDLVYDGAPKMLIDAGMSEHGTFYYRLSETDDWSRDIPTAIDGGNYTVYWKLVGDSNHSDVEGDVPVPVTIGRCQIPLTTADFTFTPPAELTYSGTPKAAKVEARGKTGVGDITVKYDKDPVNAGTYKVSIDVAAGANYEAATGLTHDNWVFTINKAKPVIKWDPKEFTYNGAPQGEATVELIGSDTYTGKIQYYFVLNENISREGLPVRAGTYVVYASTETTDNYEAEFEKETIRINPKEVTPTVVIEPEYFTYDGTSKEPAVKVMDDETEIPAKEYNVAYVAYTGDTKQVGAATVTVSDAVGGNYTIGEVSKVYLILPDASALEGVTTDNVNSSHQAAIDEIQAAMAGKDITGASTAAKWQWMSLVNFCAGLEEKLSDIDTAQDELADAISDLPQQPKTSDLDAIDDILEQYEALEDNLTDAEKKALEEEIGKLEDTKAAMTLTNTNLKEVTDGSDALDEDDLDFADKATIKDLLEKAENLESNPYLTDEQVFALANTKEQLEKLEDKFAAAEKVEKDHLNKLPAEADPDDEDAIKAYEAAKKAYTDLGTAGKAKVDPKAVKKLEGLRTELTDYEIIKGSGAKWVKGSSKGLTFTANGYHPHFEGVEIDGKLIDDDYYTDKSGSTIVTLKASYLQKLKTGKHTITILFGDGDYTGEAEGTFKVSYTADSPATGDSGIILPICLAIGSLLCLAVLVVNKKKFYQK